MTYYVGIMTPRQDSVPDPVSAIRQARLARGWTQQELATRAGISRTAVTEIEAGHLVPSVNAALALARALEQTVEDLFAPAAARPDDMLWAGPGTTPGRRVWRAEVQGRLVGYPAETRPMLTLPPDGPVTPSDVARQTLVVACCDPAAGLLAQCYAAATGMRLVVLSRSSRQALELLKQGLVHVAGLHLATADRPEDNACEVQQTLGLGYELVRVATWQEGIALGSANRLRSASAVRKAKLRWIGREPGSGARQCQDRLLVGRTPPEQIARHHRAVAEAIQSGWADAGVCLQLTSEEAGLSFLPIQEEAYDLCYAKAFEHDPRLRALRDVLRSRDYRERLGGLPGYSTAVTGEIYRLP